MTPFVTYLIPGMLLLWTGIGFFLVKKKIHLPSSPAGTFLKRRPWRRVVFH